MKLGKNKYYYQTICKNNDYRKYDLNAANSFMEGARLVTMFLVMNIIMIINIVMLIWCFSFFFLSLSLSLFFFFFLLLLLKLYSSYLMTSVYVFI